MPVQLENCMISSFALGAVGRRTHKPLAASGGGSSDSSQDGLIIAIRPGAYVEEITWELRGRPPAGAAARQASGHPGGANFLFADGSVRFFSRPATMACGMRELDDLAVRLRAFGDSLAAQSFGDPNLLLPAVVGRMAVNGPHLRLGDRRPALSNWSGPVFLVTGVNAADGSVRPEQVQGIIAVLIGL